jgi:acyl-CoA oxidase
MVRDAATALSKAVTVSTRYGAVRRQGFGMGFKPEPDTPETKILDYGSQMYAILPLVATSYALHFQGQRMLEAYAELTDLMQKGDFSTLPEVHATAAGMKAWATWFAAYGIEECRQRCGGQGFLRASGLPDLYASSVPACTYEGDNNVMLQQTARFLLKALRAGVEGKLDKLVGAIAYLKKAVDIDKQKNPVNSPADLMDPRVLVEIYEHKAIRQIILVGTKLDNEIRERRERNDANKQVFSEVWNWLMPDFKAMVKAHCLLIILNNFVASVIAIKDQRVRAVMQRVLALFALFHLEQDVSTVLIDKYFTRAHVDMLSRQLKEVMFQIRKDAVPLVDAFNFSDTTLNSAIGRYDGKVYEALFDSALKNPLNQFDVSPGFDDILKPLMNTFKSNL